jgi:hypothetical protein
MTRAGFEDRVAKILCDPGFVASNEDWADISLICQFHPAISQVRGEEEIANYYTLGIWRDMVPAAEEACKLELAIAKLQKDKIRINEEYMIQINAINDNIADAQEKSNAFTRKYRRYV